MVQRLSCLLVLFAMFFMSACGEEIEPGNSSQSPQGVTDVVVETVHVTDQPLIYEGVGTVKAGISSNLASKLLGTVEAVRVREGDEVKQGDTLVIIDQRQVKAALHGAEAGVSEAKKALSAAVAARNAARAEEKLASATYERYLNLERQDSVSDQEFEEVEARYRQAQATLEKAKAMLEAATARVKQAQAALSAARVNRKDSVIKAPGDGIITAKMVDKGDLAKPGTPLLILETTHGFCVDVVLPETYIDYVRPQQKVSVEVPALKTGLLEAIVCTVVPSADVTMLYTRSKPSARLPKPSPAM